RRVEHVGRGQPVVEPLRALGADRGGDDVDERRHVVVGDLLPLVDRLDREGGAVARRGGDLGRDDALFRPRVGGGELDPEPGLELRLLGPDGADLGAAVARDHALIIRAASTPAFSAPSIATQATGVAAGTCAVASSASDPSRPSPASGTPITGRSVWPGGRPGGGAAFLAPSRG